MNRRSGPVRSQNLSGCVLGEVNTLSRRRFLEVGAAGAALGGASVSAASGIRAISRPRRRSTRGLRGPKIDPTLLKLVNRITMGYSRATYAEADALGYDAYLESQLDSESIDDSEWESRLAQLGYSTLTMTSQEVYDNFSEMNQGTPINELITAAILRAIYSKKQLLERMVQFWTYHFNIDIRDGQCGFLKTADDRDVIRQHALGTFPDLLRASAESAAMLFYLDNYANTAGNAQENYARELMELHTMGVDGGYTQNDVQEVARCLTGWTFYGRASGHYGDFVFWKPFHDLGSKTVLGQFIPSGGGVSDGDTVLDILINHPSTARFIAKKLCTWFLGYNPPEDIVESVKVTYQSTGGDIKEMLRVILHPNVLTFLATPKLKRPFHLVASLLRATEADVLGPRYLEGPLYLMGQLPFFWPTPDGYPDSLEVWGKSLLPRWQYSSTVFDRPDAVSIDAVGLLNSEVGTEAEAINRILTGGVLSQEEETLIQDFYDDVSPSAFAASDTFGLAASFPGFQWY